MFDQTPLEDLFVTPQRNGLTKPKRIRGEGVKMVNMGELFSTRRIHNLPMDRVPCTERELTTNRLESGDLLFARQSLTLEGAGQSSIFIGDEEDVVFESHLIRCRFDKTRVDPLYFFYFFESKFGKQRVGSIVEQVAAAGIRGSDLVKLPVVSPPIGDQKAIAHILGTLDDRIEINQKMNETLEEIAKAVFKSWFVDFDPVRAKMEGRQTGLPDNISDLFPDELVDSEIGEIPKGWNIQSLGNLVVPKKGKSITKKNVGEGNIPVVAGGLSPAYYHNVSNVKAPVVTISASGANAGFARLYSEDIWASDCSYISENESSFNTLWYVFLKINQEKIYHMQQGAVQPHIYPSDLMRLQLAMPNDDKLWSFANNIISPVFERKGLSDKEIAVLSEIRDTLLPKLISGELTIPAPEKFLDEVGI